ncbi:MAG: prevent-host-death family protein [Gemmatimonadota bacterium]
MRTIGIRELKAQLSQAIRDVQGGETLLVTDRGRVVAELRRPDAAQSAAGTPQARALARMVADGHLKVAERQRVWYAASPLRSEAGLARELLDEERGDG